MMYGSITYLIIKDNLELFMKSEYENIINKICFNNDLGCILYIIDNNYKLTKQLEFLLINNNKNTDYAINSVLYYILNKHYDILKELANSNQINIYILTKKFIENNSHQYNNIYITKISILLLNIIKENKKLNIVIEIDLFNLLLREEYNELIEYLINTFDIESTILILIS